MKKLFCIVASALLFVACGSNNGSNKEAEKTVEAAPATECCETEKAECGECEGEAKECCEAEKAEACGECEGEAKHECQGCEKSGSEECAQKAEKCGECK